MKISFASNTFPNRINNYYSQKKEAETSVSFCAKKTAGFDLFESSRFKKYKVLAPEELQRLEICLMSSNEKRHAEAREELILSFLPLVFRISQEYASLVDKGGYSTEDIIQSGILGLINSIDAFDIEKGHDFTKFVEYGINGQIIKSMKYKNMIRLPRLKRKLYLDAINIYERLSGKVPEPLLLEQVSKKLGVPVKDVRDVLSSGQRPVSLEEFYHGDCSCKDLLFDEEKSVPAEVNDKLRNEDMRKETAELLKRILTPKQYRVARLRFGLEGGEPLKKTEIGKIMGTTSSNIYNIELKILKKLNKSKELRQIYKNYVKDNE